MFKNIFGHFIYQLTVVLALLFAGKFTRWRQFNNFASVTRVTKDMESRILTELDTYLASVPVLYNLNNIGLSSVQQLATHSQPNLAF